ncbi:GMC family oxidoreductase [Longimicrobium sp.]|uniref:GMC family oxidoreductase n=1 Tax=Longimicrobium sp. TaxID=2029185 RepID=UPI002C3FC619|nr:GMC family oxidoreductase [Longimicrobium sp.]HSU14018.1 GMC family oxidoreductase [Longimicrobium sp.]
MVVPSTADEFDAVVVGSGFGGCMAALELVDAGWRVLMLERGGWVERGPHNWTGEGAFVRTPYYAADTAFDLRHASQVSSQNLCTCVGGPSVFYGGASFRFRERDFDAAPEIVGGTGAAWPVDYAALEPFYTRAERLLGVAGEAGVDPTEPPRSAPYPQPPSRLSGASRRMAEAMRSLGLHPFRIPLAINHAAAEGAVCQACTTCDTFACAVSAKNDLAVRVLPHLLAGGMEIRPGTVATRVLVDGERATGVECVDKASGEKMVFRAGTVVLAAGALATPHLLLASGLEKMNPAGDAVGRYLMRHCNAMTFGVFPRRPNPENEHHKQMAVHDFYFGSPEPGAPAGPLGNMQQIMGPQPSLIGHVLPKWMKWAVRLAEVPASRLTGILSIAEDQPRAENRVRLDPERTDAYGVPRMVVEHDYTARDLAARRFMIRKAKQILRRAGALFCVNWDVSTFSHAVGTVRMGEDESTSPLDSECRFRGVEGLYVTDGSVFPTSAGVNPSLTIAANALRVGRLIARGAGVAAAAAGGNG